MSESSSWRLVRAVGAIGLLYDRRRPWRSSAVRPPTAPSSGSCRPSHDRSFGGFPRATSPARPSTTPCGSCAELNGQGKLATVDVLGEEITNPDEARAIAGQYHDLLARIDAEGLDSNISIKLTALGLDLDLDLCRENLEAVVSDAQARESFVRIDMEDSTTTDRTLQLYRDLPSARPREPRHRRSGVPGRTINDVDGCRERQALQGDLRRTAGDCVPRLRCRAGELRARAREARCARLLRWDRDARRVPDRRGATDRRATSPRDRYEFQMLLGVRPSAPTSSSRPATVSASTCRTARSGTSTRCDGYRRTRRSRATSRGDTVNRFLRRAS